MFTPLTVVPKNNWPGKNQLMQRWLLILAKPKKFSLKKLLFAVIVPKASAAKIIANASEREDNAHLSVTA